MISPDRRAGALVQRLAAFLCLAGAGLFGLAAALVSRLDHAPGTEAYRLPGGAALDPAALTVLLACTGVFSLLGVAALLLAPARLPQVQASHMKRRRPAFVLMLGIAALLAVLAARRFGF